MNKHQYYYFYNRLCSYPLVSKKLIQISVYTYSKFFLSARWTIKYAACSIIDTVTRTANSGYLRLTTTQTNTGSLASSRGSRHFFELRCLGLGFINLRLFPGTWFSNFMNCLCHNHIYGGETKVSCLLKVKVPWHRLHEISSHSKVILLFYLLKA